MQPYTTQEDPHLLEEIQRDFAHPKRKKKAKVEVKKANWKLRIYGTIVLIAVVASGVWYAAESYAKWREDNAWQFPAKWIGMIRRIEHPTAVLAATAQAKVLTEDEIIHQYKLHPYIASIYMLESTKGKNDDCRKDGKFNGYGYRQNSREHICYDSFEKVTEKVNEWLEDRLSNNGHDIIEAICYYNTGLQGQMSCGDYSANFSSVLTDNLD